MIPITRLASGLLLLAVVTRASIAQPFILSAVDADAPGMSFGSLSVVDFDANGAMDLLVLGNTASSLRDTPRPRTLLAVNRSSGPYGTDVPFDLTQLAVGVWHGSSAWTDFDGDGVLDVVVTGASTSGSVLEGGVLAATTTLYRGTNGGLEPVSDSGLIDLYAGSVGWADVDRDGTPDLLVSGLDTGERPRTRLYRNENGSLVEQDSALPDRALGEAAWADVDGDGDLDVLLSGTDAEYGFHVQLFENDGTGQFSLLQELEPLAFTSADWADYDADGDPDLVVAGGRLSFLHQVVGVTRLYRNDGGVLTAMPDEFDGALYGSVRWIDYDNDGRLDIMVNGMPRPNSGRVGSVYRNEGTFRRSSHFLGTFGGNAAWADMDADGDADLVVTGLDVRASPTLAMMRNDSRRVNNDPHPPSTLSAGPFAGGVTLTWDAGSDDETAAPSLTYNLSVQDGSGRFVMPSLSDVDTGRRLVPRPGNVGSDRSWSLSGLPPGTYAWAVQTVDASFRGSTFESGPAFTVPAGSVVGTGAPGPAELPESFAVDAAWPNPFVDGTAIRVRLPRAERVTVEVFDMRGALVDRVLDGPLAAGVHPVTWRPEASLATGVYLVQIRAGASITTRSVVRWR